ncbi:MAG: molybdate ABC transporter substrate-binding protein, partial [Desulfuromonas sp.]
MKRIVILVMMFSNLGVTVTAADVRLSVAASLTEATRELIDVYGQQHPGTKVLPNFAASGALAKQIAQGAPADLFISANPKWMNYLVEEQL